MHAIVAERSDGYVIGMANYIIHDNTATLTPVCYLQDLFVDPNERARGVGQALIDWLVTQMQASGWSRLYWNTKENNYRARGLYDKYTPHSGFLRYVVMNPEAPGSPVPQRAPSPARSFNRRFRRCASEVSERASRPGAIRSAAPAHPPDQCAEAERHQQPLLRLRDQGAVLQMVDLPVDAAPRIHGDA